MSHEFKINFDKMLETDPLPSEGNPDNQQSNYIEAGHYRNICFLWPEGRKLFLSYSYLISCEHIPDEASIIMEFTAYTIQIKGVQLEPLFYLLMNQHARLITCTDERYNAVETRNYTINEIVASKNS